MNSPDSSGRPPIPPGTASWWSRRMAGPIMTLLTHGVTPDKVAATIAVGTACSLFPFLGFTTMLNLGVGLWLRMNQPILQTINYLITPLHLVMIMVYVRVGERIWGAQDASFTLTEVVTTFREASIADFLARFGWAGVHAFTAWVLSLPLIIVCIYYPLRPVLRSTARRLSA